MLTQPVIANQHADSREAITARLEHAGATLKASMEIGAQDLVGIDGWRIGQPDLDRSVSVRFQLIPSDRADISIRPSIVTQAVDDGEFEQLVMDL